MSEPIALTMAELSPFALMIILTSIQQAASYPIPTTP